MDKFKKLNNFQVVESFQVENSYDVSKLDNNRYFVNKTVWNPYFCIEEITEEQAKRYYDFKLNGK